MLITIKSWFALLGCAIVGMKNIDHIQTSEFREIANFHVYPIKCICIRCAKVN
jgi:hypothetical protein